MDVEDCTTALTRTGAALGAVQVKNDHNQNSNIHGQGKTRLKYNDLPAVFVIVNSCLLSGPGPTSVYARTWML